jgi:probable HAF family extracellular repeat protein
MHPRWSNLRRILLALLCALVADLRGQSVWEVRPGVTSSSLNAVVFGNGLFVAVGDNGTIGTSPDGEDWTPRESGTTDPLPAIAFGNGRFVATCANRAHPAITSVDGINWTPVSLIDSNGTPATSRAFDGIGFGNGRFLAVGSVSLNSTEIMASPDGISFQTVDYARYPAPDYLLEALKSVTFFRGRFIAGARDAGFFVSSDGIAWKHWGGASGPVVATDGISKVAILGSAAFSIDAAHTFLRTETPVDRYSAANVMFPNFTAMCYGAGGFVAADTVGRIWTSERGEFWLPRGRYAKAEEGFRGVAFDGFGRFVSVGSAPASGSALIAVAQADPPRTQPPGYTIYSLKELSNGVFSGEPRSVSNSGHIAGSISRPEIGSKGSSAAIFHDGKITAYPDPLYGQYSTVAFAVNSNGIAAAEVLFGTYYAGIALPEQVQTFPGAGIYSSAISINSNGSIAGTYFNFEKTVRGIYRYDTATGVRVEFGNLGLGKIDATSINDRGDIAGSYVYETQNENDHLRAFRLSAEGELTLIPTLGGTYIRTVVMNSFGDVAGTSTMPSAPASVFETHAFLFHDGSLSDIDGWNTQESVANAINSHGDVVGFYDSPNYAAWQSTIGNAFLYHDGAMYDLSSLLDESGDGWLLHYANSINDNGWIVGEGWRHGEHLEPFLAIPNGGKPAGIQTRFVNVSTRLRTGVGDDALIAGFILHGGPKKVVLRAMGPALTNFGNPSATLPNLLADPTLELFNERGERVASNDNYSDLPFSPDQNEIGSFGLTPPRPPTGVVTHDSVICVTLPEGSYTAVVRGKDGTSGNCLVEAYNVDTDYSPGLLNISTRGPVGSGDDVMIAGFIIQGDRERRVLVRGLGPSLAASGVANPLSDPMLEIYDQNGQIAGNNDWRSDQETEIATAGFAPGDNRDAAVILSLWPGSYTAIVRGKDNSAGNALVEVFALP